MRDPTIGGLGREKEEEEERQEEENGDGEEERESTQRWGEGDVEEEAGTRAHGHTRIRARVHTDSQRWDRGEVRTDKVRHVERRARECSAALGKVGSDVVGAELGRRPCGGGADLDWSGRPRRAAPASSRQRPTPTPTSAEENG